MSWDFLVCPAAPGQWSLTTETLVEAVQCRWPHTQVRRVPQEFRPALLEWTVSSGEDEVTCYFYDDGQTLSFEGRDELQYAQIALWYRTVVPAQHRIDFCSPENRVEIRAESTPAQLVKALIGQAAWEAWAWEERVRGDR
jgi:hypothetical protein